MVDSVKKATNTSIEAAYIVWYMIITILYIFVLTPRLVGEMQSSKDEEKKWEESTSHSCCLEGWKENRKEWANKRHNFTSLKWGGNWKFTHVSQEAISPSSNLPNLKGFWWARGVCLLLPPLLLPFFPFNKWRDLFSLLVSLETLSNPPPIPPKTLLRSLPKKKKNSVKVLIPPNIHGIKVLMQGTTPPPQTQVGPIIYLRVSCSCIINLAITKLAS